MDKILEIKRGQFVFGGSVLEPVVGDTLREIYDHVEKTDDIKRYETAPRPER